MVFSEIYGTYFQVVAEILELASRESVSEKKVREIVEEKAFAESILTIPAALKDGRWPFLDGTGKSLLKHAPSMPMTMLEKRWLKSLTLDPRIALTCSFILTVMRTVTRMATGGTWSISAWF